MRNKAREHFGLIVAAFAAAVLVVLGVEIVKLGKAAGGDLAKLQRELAGVQYVRLLQALELDLERFRDVVALHDPADGSATAARARVDAAVSSERAFLEGPGRELDAAGAERAFGDRWRTARIHEASDGSAERDALHALIHLGSVTSDNSGLTYDSDATGQSLADVVIPDDMDSIDSIDAASLGGLQRTPMTLAQHIELAVRRHDLETNLGAARTDLQELGGVVNPAALAGAKNANVAAGAFADGQLSTLIYSPERMSSASLRAARDRVVNALAARDAQLDEILATSLEDRIRIETLRSRYTVLFGIFSVVFVIGLIWETVGLASRRSRQLVLHAERESERLGALLARERAEKALALSEARFRTVFDRASLGLAVVDRTGKAIDANALFRAHFGQDAYPFLAGHRAEFDALFDGSNPMMHFEQQYLKADRSDLWVDATVSVVQEADSKPGFAICMYRDITELKHSERRLAHDKTHDMLTGLPNRVLFENALRDRFARTGAPLESFLAVLLV
ncbi:MAG: hypothetical protein JO347_09975, partial [Candidatus Eremiobacteraeota bacterium]|nr:hypothetical protein [Candidatus Eremiobacteraeota bacterium]